MNITNQAVSKVLMVTLMLCSILNANDITLSGTVKDNTGKLLEGVTVKLANNNSLSVVTNADGAFTLTNAVGVHLPNDLKTLFGLAIRNNSIVFTSVSEKVSGSISLYSINGKLISSATLQNLSAGQAVLALPSGASSGSYLLAGTLNGKSFTRSLVFIGNSQLTNEVAAITARNRSFTLNKTTSVSIVDTLIACKQYYDTTRYPLHSYSASGIEIVLAEPIMAVNALRLVNGEVSPWIENNEEEFIEFKASTMFSLINGGAQIYVNHGVVEGFQQTMAIDEKLAFLMVMNFGTTSNASEMYVFTDAANDEKSAVGNYNLSVAELDNSPMNGVIAIAHFGKYYMELSFSGYNDKSEAQATAASFIEVFESKISNLK